MRHAYILGLGALLALSSCSMYEDMPDKPGYPTVRINQSIAEVQSLLRGSDEGWHLVFVPGMTYGQYGGFNTYLQFTSDKDVTMQTEDIGKTGSYSSTYHFSTDGGIRLTFDVYNTAMHSFSEPYWGVPTSYDGDYQFMVMGISEDRSRITLKGTHTGSTMYLEKMQTAAGPVLEGIRATREAISGKALSPLSIGGKEVRLSIFGYARKLRVQYDDKQELLPFAYTADGLRLLTPYSIGDATLSELKLSADKSSMTTADGATTMSLFSPEIDLTKRYVTAYYDKEYASARAMEAFDTMNAWQQWVDYKGTFLPSIQLGFDTWPTSQPNIGTQTDMGWNSPLYTYYYCDFAAVYGEPRQFHFTPIIQQGLGWFYVNKGLGSFLDDFTSLSPFSFGETQTTDTGSEGAYLSSTVDSNYSVWVTLKEAPSSSSTSTR